LCVVISFNLLYGNVLCLITSIKNSKINKFFKKHLECDCGPRLNLGCPCQSYVDFSNSLQKNFPRRLMFSSTSLFSKISSLRFQVLVVCSGQLRLSVMTRFRSKWWQTKIKLTLFRKWNWCIFNINSFSVIKTLLYNLKINDK
jgi:hypothetical protein